MQIAKCERKKKSVVFVLAKHHFLFLQSKHGRCTGIGSFLFIIMLLLRVVRSNPKLNHISVSKKEKKKKLNSSERALMYFG